MPIVHLNQTNPAAGNQARQQATAAPQQEAQAQPQNTEDISTQLDQKLNQVNTPNTQQQMPAPTSATQPAPQSAQPANTQPAASTNAAPANIELREYTLEEIINEAISREASDIHLTVDYRAMLRVDGELIQLPSTDMTNEKMRQFAEELTTTRPDIQLDTIHQADLSYAFANRRFRVNIFKEMGNFAIVMRLIPKEIKTIDELKLPSIFHEFAKVPAGLILVTGPTGSGKSTTLASIINEINQSQRQHIVTVEDPIEFVYPEGQSIVEQREMGLDFDSFPQALKSLLRQDPNVVLVGEMRDYETISSAITVSETGHLVFATLHTNSASQTMDRIIDVFPEAQQAQIRSQLSNVITAVVSQRLVKKTDGKRAAVHEIMIANPAVKNAIREQKTHQIDNMIQTGEDFGMVSMEKGLVEMIRKGEITKDAALEVTIKPKELDILLNKI